MTKLSNFLQLENTLQAIRNQAQAIASQAHISEQEREQMMFEGFQYEAEQETNDYNLND